MLLKHLYAKVDNVEFYSSTKENVLIFCYFSYKRSYVNNTREYNL